MEFKELKRLVYSPLIAIMGDRKKLVNAREPHEWDSAEVIGVRAREMKNLGEVVEVNLCTR